MTTESITALPTARSIRLAEQAAHYRRLAEAYERDAAPVIEDDALDAAGFVTILQDIFYGHYGIEGFPRSAGRGRHVRRRRRSNQQRRTGHQAVRWLGVSGNGGALPVADRYGWFAGPAPDHALYGDESVGACFERRRGRPGA